MTKARSAESADVIAWIIALLGIPLYYFAVSNKKAS